MMQRERVRRGYLGLFLVAVLGVLSACGNPGGEGCGGIDDIVSCLSITSIQPTATVGGDSSDVDVVFNTDCDPLAAGSQPEPFTAHDARVTFANNAFPTASTTTTLAITIQRVSVSYTLNNCPAGAACPPLPGFTQETSLLVPAGGTATGTFPLVPLSTKQAFVDQGGSARAFPAYSANYTFTAETPFFQDTITLNGSVAVTLGAFDLCP